MTTASPKILVINPGSTSTKISLFAGKNEIITESLKHPVETLTRYLRIFDQAEFRRAAIGVFITTNQIDLTTVDAVIGRGGVLHPLTGGVYAVNDAMIADLASGRYGEHASNLGAILAREYAADAGCPAFIADPIVVDEMDDVARFSGIPEIERKSIFHALNQKSAAREAASRIHKEYGQSNLIVAHMGGGCSVGAHRHGRVVDVNNALDGDGPFSAERAGTLPARQLVELALSSAMSGDDLKKRINGQGGIVAYCGTNSLEDLFRRIERGDSTAKSVFDAMAYQIAKEIASHGATLAGEVDAIVLTGGMANSAELVAAISDRVAYLAPIIVIAGEREMQALAQAARMALSGDESIRVYR